MSNSENKNPNSVTKDSGTTTAQVHIPGWIPGLAYKILGMPLFRIVVLAFVATTCGIAWQQQDKLLDTLSRAVEQRQEERRSENYRTALSDFIIRQRQIEALVTSARTELGASRVIQAEFHNGTENLRGVSFLFFSAVAESASAGVSREIDNLKRVSLSGLVDVVQSFLRRECVSFNNANSPQVLQGMLESAAVVYTVACPVFTSYNSEPTGFVFANYSRTLSENDVANAQRRLRETAISLGAVTSAYLDTIRR
jgi:hypothetical protein